MNKKNKSLLESAVHGAIPLISKTKGGMVTAQGTDNPVKKTAYTADEISAMKAHFIEEPVHFLTFSEEQLAKWPFAGSDDSGRTAYWNKRVDKMEVVFDGGQYEYDINDMMTEWANADVLAIWNSDKEMGKEEEEESSTAPETSSQTASVTSSQTASETSSGTAPETSSQTASETSSGTASEVAPVTAFSRPVGTERTQPNRYSENIKAEVYHPAVFDKWGTRAAESDDGPLPNYNPGGIIPGIDNVVPESGLNSTRLRNIKKDFQVDYGEKISVHKKRMEIAAKASLLLYRSLVNDIEADKERRKNQIIDRLYAEYLERSEEIPKGTFIERNQASINSTYNAQYSGLDALYLTEEVATAILGMEKAGDDLPTSLDRYRASSCYGLWGKWYTRATRFHRGIDITFNGNTYLEGTVNKNPKIYSICEGRRVDGRGDGGEDSNTLTSRTVEVTRPLSNGRTLYLTYMHADFVGDVVGSNFTLSSFLGNESYHMAGGVSGRDNHTHIEINATAQPGYAQAKRPDQDICSLSPYKFLEDCFKCFYDKLAEWRASQNES